MGSAASKAPKRAFPKGRLQQRTESAEPKPAQVDANASTSQAGQQIQEQIDQEPSGDIEQDFLRQLKQEGVKDADLGSFLDKLGGAIAGKQVSTLDSKQQEAHRLSQLQREQGRLNSAGLRQLFHEVHRMEQSQAEMKLEVLSERFGIDKDLLKKVLHFNRIPAITQAADGRLFGNWQIKS